MQNEHPPSGRQKLSPRKIASYAAVVTGALTLVCVLVLLLFSDPLVNRFIKPGITEAFAEAYPAYSVRIGDMRYSVLQNRFECDSVALNAVDTTASCTIGALSVSGIDWMHLLWGGQLGPMDCTDALLDAQTIAMHFPESNYEVHCQSLRISVPDSEIVADLLELHPRTDDEGFFRGSTFRSTRIRLATPQCSVVGLACLELLEGKSYRTRSVIIRDPFLDVLINKDKPSAKYAAPLLMPNEILSSIQKALQVDSLTIHNGRVKYGERFAVGEKPALITLDSIHVLVEGITNHGDSGAAIVMNAQGQFMKAGAMKVHMSIPVASPAFSFQYSGSLGGMNLSALNPFLETAEEMRIVAGVLQSATFTVHVDSGRASGTVRAVYKGVVVSAINKQTGSEGGLVDGITSFIANTFTIRGTNLPDKSGAMKIGDVKYLRQPDDSFFRFVWFALRTGMRDVAGF